MNKHEKTIEFYQKAAKTWHENHSKDNWWKSYTDSFLLMLPENGNVLDAGCGTGIKSNYISDAGFHVVGVDPCENMLDIARSSVRKAVFFNRTLQSSHTLYRTFHGIYCQAALLHIDRDQAAMAIESMSKCLEPHGLIYISVKKSKGEFEEEFKFETIDNLDLARWFTYYTVNAMKNLILDAGLHLVCIEEVPETDWIVVIARK